MFAQRGNAVDLIDPISSCPKQVHVSRCRAYVAREGEDPLAEAVRNSAFYLVDSILTHSFDPPTSKSLKALRLSVLWRGFLEPTTEVGTNKSLLKTEAFKQYTLKCPELTKFLPK